MVFKSNKQRKAVMAKFRLEKSLKFFKEFKQLPRIPKNVEIKNVRLQTPFSHFNLKKERIKNGKITAKGRKDLKIMGSTLKSIHPIGKVSVIITGIKK